MTLKKKLIEVALPLPEINDASAYDKMPGIGPHPKGIHHWWARLPLPFTRADREANEGIFEYFPSSRANEIANQQQRIPSDHSGNRETDTSSSFTLTLHKPHHEHEPRRYDR